MRLVEALDHPGVVVVERTLERAGHVARPVTEGRRIGHGLEHGRADNAGGARVVRWPVLVGAEVVDVVVELFGRVRVGRGGERADEGGRERCGAERQRARVARRARGGG